MGQKVDIKPAPAGSESLSDQELIAQEQKKQNDAKELQAKAKAVVTQEKRQFMQQYVLHRALACKIGIPAPEILVKDAGKAWELIAATKLERWNENDA